jgi:hypothetical protein
MNKQEATKLLQDELGFYQNKTYAELVSLINEEFVYERQGPSGIQYQIEILIMWDLTPNRAILILGSIDDGGWRAFMPLTESIVRYPDDAI